MTLRIFLISLLLFTIPLHSGAQFDPYWSLHKQYDSVKTPCYHYNIVHTPNAWTIICDTGKPILPDTFKNIEYTLESDQFAVQQSNGLWGIIDTTGHLLSPAIYDTILLWQRRGPNVAICKGITMLIDNAGTPLTHQPYTYIEATGKRLYAVKQYDKTGIIDRTGREIIPPIYDDIIGSIPQNDEDTAFLIAIKDGQYGIIHPTTFQCGPLIYSHIYYLVQGIGIATRNGKYALIDNTGTLLTDLIYDDMLPACYNTDVNITAGNVQGSIIFINGRPVPYICSRGYYTGEGRISMLCDSSESSWSLFCLADTFGHLLSPCIYEQIGRFHNGWARVTLERSLSPDGLSYSYINTSGQLMKKDTFFSSATPFENGLAWARHKKWNYLIDSTGNTVASYYSPEDYIPNKVNTAYNRIIYGDSLGTNIIDLHGHHIYRVRGVDQAGRYFSEGLLSVMIPISGSYCKKFGYMDTNGHLKPFTYSYAGPFSDGRALVVIKNKVGFIDTSGQLVIPAIYDPYLAQFEDGKATVWQDNKCFTIDKNGNILNMPRRHPNTADKIYNCE